MYHNWFSMLARQLNMYPSSQTRFSCYINYILKSVNLAVNVNRKAQILEGLSRSESTAPRDLNLNLEIDLEDKNGHLLCFNF